MNETAIDLRLLSIFVAVVEAESFSKDAVELGVTKGTVSRSIARLESDLGVELLHRTTHQVALSTAGTALYERAATHVHALGQAISALPERDVEPSGLLRLTAPHDFGATVLAGVLPRFCLRYPKIQLDVRLTNEAVDLVAEGFDVAIRAGGSRLKDSSLVARKLGAIEAGLYASPTYLARRGEPRRFGDPDHAWVGFARGNGVLTTPGGVDPQLLCDDLTLLCNLLIHDAGIGGLPTFIAAPHLATGALVRVLEKLRLGKPGGMYFLYPSSGQVPRKVTALRDFLLAARLL